MDLKLYFIVFMIIRLYYLILGPVLISQASYNYRYSKQALLCMTELTGKLLSSFDKHPGRSAKKKKKIKHLQYILQLLHYSAFPVLY